MAHNLDMSNNRANIAFLGSRNDVWHRLGREMPEGQGVDAWAKAAGLDWQAIKVPAMLDLRSSQFDKVTIRDGNAQVAFVPARDRSFIVRSDTAGMLGDNCVSDVYQPVQPREILAWFDNYISVDETVPARRGRLAEGRVDHMGHGQVPFPRRDRRGQSHGARAHVDHVRRERRDH